MTADRPAHATGVDGFWGDYVVKLYDPLIWVCGETTVGTKAQMQL